MSNAVVTMVTHPFSFLVVWKARRCREKGKWQGENILFLENTQMQPQTHASKQASRPASRAIKRRNSVPVQQNVLWLYDIISFVTFKVLCTANTKGVLETEKKQLNEDKLLKKILGIQRDDEEESDMRQWHVGFSYQGNQDWNREKEAYKETEREIYSICGIILLPPSVTLPEVLFDIDFPPPTQWCLNSDWFRTAVL